MLLDIPEIVVAAAGVRRSAGLTEPPYSTQQIIDGCFPDVLVTGDELPAGVAEMTFSDGGRTIIYNRKMATGMHRVAIAHGLGHLVFDDRLSGRHRFSTQYDSKEFVERRADLFAGELLVPLVDLDPAAGVELFPRDAEIKRAFADMVDQLASWFAVPAGFIRWRLWDLLHFRRSNFYLGKSPVKK